MTTRRRFLKLGVLSGVGVFLYSKLGFLTRAFGAIPGGTLDPKTISKYQMPLIIPPAMPRTAKIKVKGEKNVDYYEIAVRQFQQQILPTGMPQTTVWSACSHPMRFSCLCPAQVRTSQISARISSCHCWSYAPKPARA